MNPVTPSAVRPLSRLEAESIASRVSSLQRLPLSTAGVYVSVLAAGRSWPEDFLDRSEVSAIRAALREMGPRPGRRS